MLCLSVLCEQVSSPSASHSRNCLGIMPFLLSTYQNFLKNKLLDEQAGKRVYVLGAPSGNSQSIVLAYYSPIYSPSYFNNPYTLFCNKIYSFLNRTLSNYPKLQFFLPFFFLVYFFCSSYYIVESLRFLHSRGNQ